MSDLNGSAGMVTLLVNGKQVTLPRGSMAIAALLKTGTPCRVSVSGEERTALCGMGICFECRATVNGVAQQRTCQIVCKEGMTVETQ